MGLNLSLDIPTVASVGSPILRNRRLINATINGIAHVSRHQIETLSVAIAISAELCVAARKVISRKITAAHNSVSLVTERCVCADSDRFSTGGSSGSFLPDKSGFLTC